MEKICVVPSQVVLSLGMVVFTINSLLYRSDAAHFLNVPQAERKRSAEVDPRISKAIVKEAIRTKWASVIYLLTSYRLDKVAVIQSLVELINRVVVSLCQRRAAVGGIHAWLVGTLNSSGHWQFVLLL